MSKSELLTPPNDVTIVPRVFDESDTIISTMSASRPYNKKEAQFSLPLFKSQKNVVNAIKFLTKCNCTDATLMIVSSDWNLDEIRMLLVYFPELKGVKLYVIRPEYIPVVKIMHPKITVDVWPRESRELKKILICSITCDIVSQELDMQHQVCRLIDPMYACLKFRPTFTKGYGDQRKRYFGGSLHTICFGRPASLETKIYYRKGNKDVNYNLHDYESRMFCYNTITRRQVINGEYFDEVYCMYILQQYIRSGRTNFTLAEMWLDIRTQLH